LHWTDPTTLELLDLIIDQAPTANLLILLTCRPEFEPAWGLRSHLTPIAFNRLTRAQIEMMIDRVTGGKTLPSEVMQHLVDKTDGVPLYVEEMTKVILEAGVLQESHDGYALTGPLTPLAIPSTLQDSLMARLDRLGAAEKYCAAWGRSWAGRFPLRRSRRRHLWTKGSCRKALSSW
jgi:predicted ATPase